MRVGWIERVSLPDFGLGAVAAKVDTGARTSALHVIAARPVAGGTGSADRLLVVLMGMGIDGKRRSVEVDVEDWVVVRDTSGRRQRRPVIRTILELGRSRRTIRLGLTDRGDMRYPLLIGRTALPPGTQVDPHARYLLAGVRPAARATLASVSAGGVGRSGKI